MQLAVIKVPSVLGRPTGVERLPEALEAAGLFSGLPVAGTTVVDPPPYRPEREPSGVLNAQALAGYSRTLADAVGQALTDGRFALGSSTPRRSGRWASRRRPGRHCRSWLARS